MDQQALTLKSEIHLKYAIVHLLIKKSIEGKFVRVGGDIYKYKGINTSRYLKSQIRNAGNKVANTPQELIEVGDLVVDMEYGYPFRVDGVTNTKLGVRLLNDIDGWIIPLKDITKILTPNSKGDYIKQWEAE